MSTLCVNPAWASNSNIVCSFWAVELNNRYLIMISPAREVTSPVPTLKHWIYWAHVFAQKKIHLTTAAACPQFVNQRQCLCWFSHKWFVWPRQTRLPPSKQLNLFTYTNLLRMYVNDHTTTPDPNVATRSEGCHTVKFFDPAIFIPFWEQCQNW